MENTLYDFFIHSLSCIRKLNSWIKIVRAHFPWSNLYSVHSTPKKFENATINGHLGFVFEEKLGREIKWLF